MKKLTGSFFFFFLYITAQAQPDVEPRSYNFGGVPLANQFFATFIIKNTGSDKVYLLKVEADKTITAKKPEKAIPPGASDTLRVWYTPETEGTFNKELKAYFSDSPTPITLSLKGNLLKLDNDPTVNCYSFSQKAAGINIILCDVKIRVEDAITGNPVEGASVTQYFNSKPSFTMKANSEGIVSLSLKPNLYRYWIEATGYQTIFVDRYINRETGMLVFKVTPLNQQVPVSNNKTENKTDTKADENNGELSTSVYASNNIVFLIDISASMKRKDKLPLLKESMHKLIDQLRPIDKVSIITYADEAKVIYPCKAVTDKEALKRKVDSLIALGSTSVNKGITLAHKVAIENYIEDGNNQIILATDGAFIIREKEMNLFENGDKKLMITILGFGSDKDTLHDLKKLSSRLDGHYIYIEDDDQAKEALVAEIKKNSKRKK